MAACEDEYNANSVQNVASDYTPNRKLTSKSGTLAYLAPEVYKGCGYGPGADWWSLGVLFYECIYNKVRYLAFHFYHSNLIRVCSDPSKVVHKRH
jgi:serine/threonine protein kinase